MRDPNRIYRVLNLLGRAWKRQPDQRLGQFLLNLCRDEPNWPDVFDVKDDKLEELIRKELLIKPPL